MNFDVSKVSGDEDGVNMSGVYCDSAPPDQERNVKGALEETRLWVQALRSGGDTTAIITQEQAQQSRRQDKDCQTKVTCCVQFLYT